MHQFLINFVSALGLGGPTRMKRSSFRKPDRNNKLIRGKQQKGSNNKNIFNADF